MEQNEQRTSFENTPNANRVAACQILLEPPACLVTPLVEGSLKARSICFNLLQGKFERRNAIFRRADAADVAVPFWRERFDHGVSPLEVLNIDIVRVQYFNADAMCSVDVQMLGNLLNQATGCARLRKNTVFDFLYVQDERPLLVGVGFSLDIERWVRANRLWFNGLKRFRATLRLRKDAS